MTDEFRTAIGHHTFKRKYAATESETWRERCMIVVDDVAGTQGGTTTPLMSKSDRDQLVEYMVAQMFIPAGRYLYYAGKDLKYFNNCLLMRAEEDTRQEWARLQGNATSALMSGAGIGIDYSILRHRGAKLARTGGEASGPIPLMYAVNESGRNYMQGGSRRVAIYGSLNWQHMDVEEFLRVKNWHHNEIVPGLTYAQAKDLNPNAHAPLDMTNISLNYDDDWLNLPDRHKDATFLKNVTQALKTGEPGFSFNFWDKINETLRNACCELTSSDDSDICNLGSLNFANIRDVLELRDVIRLATKFLVCGTIRADVPYEKVAAVREQNRRLGLGIMGAHEWMMQRGYRYGMNDDLRTWMGAYRDVSRETANEFCDRLSISRPVGCRAIAPNGSIAMLPGTTSGIEPLYAVAFKRKYLTNGTDWKYELVIDGTAKTMIQDYGVDPDNIETALDLAADPERRIAFQADMQDYVDHAISSTINLPAWGTGVNNEDYIPKFAKILSDYAPRLRGFTCYPDGSRGGQPLESIPYHEAVGQEGVVHDVMDICSITGGGHCGA